MHRFFTEQKNIDTKNGFCVIRGSDVNHISHVLRMRRGEQVLLCTGRMEDQVEYLCEIGEILPDEVRARILDYRKSARELKLELYLFQAIPKGDRFETVIEKAVELGAHKIIPVCSARCVVKLDEKRAGKKTVRWNALALTAAKQSKRSFVPEVSGPVNWKEALGLARDMDKVLVPYENAEGMAHTREVIAGAGVLPKGSRLGIFVGPEGGFEEQEIASLQALDAEVITLGNRILRTDTAGIAALSMLMLHLEED